jgi:type I restriction enzyme S subunit
MKKAWRMVPLSEVATPVSRSVTVEPGQAYRTLGVKWWGQGAYERETIDGSQTAAKTLSLVKKDDLIINKIWVRHGSTAVVDEKVDGCYGSSEFPTFELNRQRIRPGWIHWQTKTRGFWHECDVLSRGTSGKNRIKPELFLTIQIPLPPLEEQRWIVARIEELAAKITEARTVHCETVTGVTALVSSLANDVFSGNSWSHIPLGDISDIRSGVTLGRELRGRTVRLPYLRVANVQDARLDLQHVKEIDVLEEEAGKWQLQSGDLLLTEGGDWDKLGRGTVWENEIPNCIHQNHIFRVRTRREDFDPYFLAAVVGSPYGKTYFQSASKQTTNLASINQRQLKAFAIPKPPLNEQRRIVAHLDQVSARTEELKKCQGARGEELEALFPSVLDRAFNGEL